MMKKILLLILSLASVVTYGQQSDAANATQFSIIRNETAPGGNTKDRIATAFDVLNTSKVNRSETVIATGTDNYTITTPYTPDYSKNPSFTIKFVNGNTGAVTVNTIPVKKNVSSALVSGDITAGSIHTIIYDGTNFQIKVPSSGGGSGVTSVAITVPPYLSVSGSPITSSGTISITTNTQNANYFLAGPVGGGTATPFYRAMVTADIPDGIVTIPKISATGTPSSSTFLRGDGSWSAGAGGSGITALTGQVTASGTGSVVATIQSSVALAGSPTTTTQSPGDNSTKIATTAYVDALSLPPADATHDGYLLAIDWSRFNGTYTLPVVTGLNMKIVSDGNSNSVGYNLPAGQDYPTQVYNILGGSGAGYSIANFGVSGQTTQNMQADAVSQIDAAYNGTKTKNFLFAWEVENDVFVNAISGATAASNMLTYWNGRKTAGFKVIGATSPYRGNNVTVNNSIKAANTAIIAAPSNYNYLIDIPAIPELSNVRGSGFQDDNVHFTYSGVLAFSRRVVTSVRTELAQTDYIPSNSMSWNGNTPDRQMIVGPLNSNALSFISGGKIRAEVTTDGTLTAIADVNARAGSAIGFYANPGLTAIANNDVLSVATFRPAYYDNGSFTGVVNDVVQIKDINGNTFFRTGSEGKISFNHTYTATSGSDNSISFSGTKTGFTTASSTFNDISQSPIFAFAGNSTNYIGLNLTATINRGAFTNTRSTILSVNSGASATSLDKAVVIAAVDGEGLQITHGGSTYGLDLQSSTSSTSAIIFNTGSGSALNVANFSGATRTALIQNADATRSGQVIPMVENGRINLTLATGSGMSFPFSMGSASGNNRTPIQTEYVWSDATDAVERAAQVFKIMNAGVLSEQVRFEGDKVSIGTGATPQALLDIKPSLGVTNGGQIMLRSNKIATTALSGTGSVVTVGFTAQPTIPFPIGTSVTITGATPSGYNGTYTVTAATTSAIIFSGSTIGAQTVAGTIVPTQITTQPGLIQDIGHDHIYWTGNGGTFQLDQQAGTGTVVVSDATDADFTMSVNTAVYLPTATLTTNRTITIPTGSNGDRLELLNNEKGFIWNLAGGSVYLSDGVTTLSSLLADTNYIIRKISGKWRILN
jgi:hypothetical protein